MSGSSRDDYERSYTETYRSYDSPKGMEERRERVEKAREEVVTKAAAPRVVRDTRKLYDDSLVRSTITRPKAGVEFVHVVLVDNSGSNRAIAQHLKESSGYLTAGLNSLDPKSQVAFIYFSDHCDAHRIMQDVDFVSPDKEGDSVLVSTISNVQDANGGDAPEAIECVLKRACEIDFGDARRRRLYLITDVVGHGMGMSEDGGCPDQQDWRKSLAKVSKTYDTFEVIGCGDDRETGDLQKQFLAPKRVALDLIDLSEIRETRHRQAITGNALLFLIARHSGPQAVQMFLSALYEKWLSDPIFAGDTDRRAKETIRRFLKYIDLPDEKLAKMESEIFAE